MCCIKIKEKKEKGFRNRGSYKTSNLLKGFVIENMG